MFYLYLPEDIKNHIFLLIYSIYIFFNLPEDIVLHNSLTISRHSFYFPLSNYFEKNSGFIK